MSRPADGEPVESIERAQSRNSCPLISFDKLRMSGTPTTRAVSRPAHGEPVEPIEQGAVPLVAPSQGRSASLLITLGRGP